AGHVSRETFPAAPVVTPVTPVSGQKTSVNASQAAQAYQENQVVQPKAAEKPANVSRETMPPGVSLSPSKGDPAATVRPAHHDGSKPLPPATTSVKINKEVPKGE
ncbi:MAG TPA: hypothetical protein PKW28_00870, partial [Turneriella sp.]|nr:hypothetical protein [Turneriella sp.]